MCRLPYFASKLLDWQIKSAGVSFLKFVNFGVVGGGGGLFMTQNPLPLNLLLICSHD